MKLLDLYIIKKYLTTFVFTVLILVSVICVIDFTEKNDDFIKHSLGFVKIVKDYYLKLIPFYANLLSPITVFIATVFVTAKLASHTEIVAHAQLGHEFPAAAGTVFNRRVADRGGDVWADRLDYSERQ